MASEFPRLRDSNGAITNLWAGPTGSNEIFTFTLQDTADPPGAINISGFDIRMIGKATRDEADSGALIAEITGTITDGPNGKFTIDFTNLNLTADSYDIFLIFKNVITVEKRILLIIQTDVINIGLVS